MRLRAALLVSESLVLALDREEVTLQKMSATGLIPKSHVAYIVWQLLEVTRFLHEAGALHLRVNTGHILLDKACGVRLTGLGNCRLLDEPPFSQYSEDPRCEEKWYLAPEALLECPEALGPASDVWSIGCVLGELVVGHPLFYGTTTEDIIEGMFGMTERPTPADLAHLPDGFNCQKLLKEAVQLPRWKWFREMDPQAMDLVEAMLRFNPRKRITIPEAIRHPYFSALREDPRLTVLPPKPFPTTEQLLLTAYAQHIRMAVEPVHAPAQPPSLALLPPESDSLQSAALQALPLAAPCRQSPSASSSRRSPPAPAPKLSVTHCSGSSRSSSRLSCGEGKRAPPRGRERKQARSVLHVETGARKSESTLPKRAPAVKENSLTRKPLSPKKKALRKGPRRELVSKKGPMDLKQYLQRRLLY